MSSKSNFFLKKTLGEDFLQSLEKFELWKPNTKSVTDVEDIHLGLKLVPRAIMSFLIKELTDMQDGEHKDIQLPLEGNCRLRIDKHGPDVFSGEVEKENKKITEFKFRPIPGVGLILMSAFELYDVEKLNDEPKNEPSDEILEQVQKMIDKRMALYDLVGKVVDKKLSERDAIQKVVLSKLTEELNKEKKDHEHTRIQLAGAGVAALGYSSDLKPGDYGHSASYDDAKRLYEEKEKIHEENKKLKKKLALNEFLEGRKKKLHKNEHIVKMSKSEEVSCPDCGQSIFKNQVYSGCVCLGFDKDSKLHITKSEGGIKVRFGKNWDIENIQLLLEVLRGRRG